MKQLLCALLLSSTLPVAAEPMVFRFRPDQGHGSKYQADLSAAVDSPFGKDLALSGEFLFSHIPQPPDADGIFEIKLAIEEGHVSVIGQTWEFKDNEVAWSLYMDDRCRFYRIEDTLTGVMRLIEPLFRAGLTRLLPEEAVDVGGTWGDETVQPISEEETLTLHSSYSLVGLAADENGEQVALIEGDVETPVAVSFVGAQFAGPFRGKTEFRILADTGRLLDLRVTGVLTLTEPGGLEITMRDIEITCDRVGDAGVEEDDQLIRDGAVKQDTPAGTLAASILEADVVDYLRDCWWLFVPLVRDVASPSHEWLPGPSVVGRYNGDYFYIAGLTYDTRHKQSIVSVEAIHGDLFQPTNQQYVSLVSRGGDGFARVGASHHWGTHLGPASMRHRASTSLTFDHLNPYAGTYPSVGRADYLTVSYSRSRSGVSEADLPGSDWSFESELALGTGFFGGDYAFQRFEATASGFYHFASLDSLALRARVVWGGGNMPAQLQDPLTDGTVLRAYSPANAPLVSKAVTGSLEWRFPVGSSGFLDDVGLHDRWASVFVDVGIGGNTAAELWRSRVYADVGVSARARIHYFDLPLDVRVSLAWPVTVNASSWPKVGFGVGWAF